MKLESLGIQPIVIPFHESFRHSSAERSETYSVLVTVRNTDGLVGYGESCPRPYVTGEDLQTVATFFSAHCERIKHEVESLESMLEWMTSHTAAIDENPAGWCAIELALLDLFSRGADQSVEQLLNLSSPAGQFQYTAVIGDCRLDTFRKLVERYAAVGMDDFKVKVTGNPDHDKRKLDVFRELQPESRVRLDGNNIWDNIAEALVYLRKLDHAVFAFEEPLASDRHAELAALAEASGIPVILDESFSRIEQFELFDAPHGRFLVNLRISKMGGIVRSLRIVEAARRRDIGLIIGAQVGETSLLTRAALTVAEQARDILVAQEGAFGDRLLRRDPWQPSLQFGAKGELDPRVIGACGFGLELQSVDYA